MAQGTARKGALTRAATGQMILELGDTSTVKNEANNLSCEIEFKTKVRAAVVGTGSGTSG